MAMKSTQRTTWSRHLVFCAVAACLMGSIQASDQCAPSIWQPGQFEKRALGAVSSTLTPTLTSLSPASSSTSSGVSNSPSASASIVPVIISPIITTGNITAGQVNCRYSATTEDLDINYYTCTALANEYGITVQTFFTLNPGLHPDCGNIQADTAYCVRGFIEPLRATAGLCGPPNNNATCLGTAYQCCNANTFKCGNSTADCADGTCYEGACAGDSVFTTNGQCGSQHGYKQCAGVWGDCCNADGKCGTGTPFCGYGVCQLGNCSSPATSFSSVSSSASSSALSTIKITSTSVTTRLSTTGGSVTTTGPATSLASTTKLSSSTTTRPSSTTTAHPSSTSTPKPSSSSTTKPSTTAATTTAKPPSTVIPGESALPSCGQTCFNNMLAQYSALGCAALDSYCLCNNVDFSNGIRDCSNGACGNAVGSTVIAFGSAYCSTAFATHTPTATGFAALPSCGQTCFNNMVGQYSALGCASPVPSCLCKNVNFGYGLRDCSNGACGTAVAPTVIAYGSSYCASATAA